MQLFINSMTNLQIIACNFAGFENFPILISLPPPEIEQWRKSTVSSKNIDFQEVMRNKRLYKKMIEIFSLFKGI